MKEERYRDCPVKHILSGCRLQRVEFHRFAARRAEYEGRGRVGSGVPGDSRRLEVDGRLPAHPRSDGDDRTGPHKSNRLKR